MAIIRPLERADLPEVVGLMGSLLPGPAHDEDFLAATLLEHPWADAELPSLVAAEGDGAITGFIAAQPRRLLFGERPIRAVCCSHLVVSEGSRSGATGALLMRRLLSGPQELTFSDTANDIVLRIWRAFGGHADHARACDWMLVLHPGRWLLAVLRTAARHERLWRELMPVGSLPAQAAGPRLLRRAFPPPESDISGEPAAPADVVECLPELMRGMQLRPDYDEPYLSHVFRLLGAREGPVTCRLVRRSGQPVGWHASVLRPGGASRVLHVSALEREREAVFGELVAHARERGSAALAGRLEPHLVAPLRRRAAALGFARQPIFHARDPELRAALTTGSSLLTRLDGEWYLA